MSRELLLPELMEPGRKPIGPSEIDLNHPLSKDIRTLIFKENDFTSLQGSGTIKHGIHGLYERYNGSSDYRLIETNGSFSDVTFYVLCRSQTLPDGHTYNGPLHSNVCRVGWDHSTSSFRGAATYRSTSGTYYRVKYGLSINTWIGLSFSVNNEGLKAYQNGNSIGQVLQGPLYISPVSIALATHAANLTTREWDGDIAIAAIWNRALSAEEHRSFHSDPYQLLKPIGT